jgi:VanZ family protein
VKRAPADVRAARWAHWYRRVLPAYWIFLFFLTHLPNLELGVRIPRSDKLAHLAAFGLLAFLFWRFCEAGSGTLNRRFVWSAAAGLFAYAALDEWLQQFVGRGTDLADFLADVVGIGCVLAVLEWRRRNTPG